MLEFLWCSRRQPFLDGLDVPFVWRYLSLSNASPQEVYLLVEQLASGSLDFEVGFLQAVKDFFHPLQVFARGPRGDDYHVYVSQNQVAILVGDRSQDMTQHLLEGGGCVGQSKRSSTPLMKSFAAAESSHLLRFLCQRYLPNRPSQINRREVVSYSKVVDGLGYLGGGLQLFFQLSHSVF